MAILTSGWRLDFDLDESKNAVHISNKGLTVYIARHSPNRQETLTSILIVGLSYVVDDALDSVLKEITVPSEHWLDVLIHDRNKLNALLLDQGIPCRLI